MEQIVDFGTPPLIEVAFGCQFEELAPLKVPHVGILWERFRKDYPIVEHAMALSTDGGLPPIDSVTGLPLPRVWFINSGESRLIQFQANRLHFNWRSRDTERQYPRHPDIAACFEKAFTRLESFANDLGLGDIRPERYELTYINHIPKGKGWETISDVPSIFPDLHWSEKKFLPFPNNLAWNWRFALPSDAGMLQVKLSQASLAADPSVPVLILELTARGIGAEKTAEGRKQWFDLAHEWVVRGFLDITSPNIQKQIWGRE